MPKDRTDSAALRVSLGQYSTSGAKPENQDFYGALVPEGSALAFKGVVAAIADGISTSDISRDAAEVAIGSFLSDYYATPDSWTVKTAGTRVIQACNAWLYGRNASLTDINKGRVCTFSALILKGQDAHVFHIGDSQIARLDGGGLEPITRSHQVSLADGDSYLGRALGISNFADLDYHSFPVSVGDVFVLTTDGIHDVLSGGQIAKHLASPDLDQLGLDEAAQNIAGQAFDQGSTDNQTVQIVRVDHLHSADSLSDSISVQNLPIAQRPQPGDVLDGFTIIRQFQVSARSYVYLAKTPTGEKAVLKIPASETAADADYMRRFQMEDWILRLISSAHVLKPMDTDIPRSALFVATEFIDGVSLRQWMTDTPNPDLTQLRDMAEQIVAGLRAIHRREMLHQDVRPENIMIDTEGVVKIIDLGSALVCGVEEASPGVLGPQPGTHQYTAPEYFLQDPVSWRSDQFSLGVILYEMLTGRLPYGAQVAKIHSRRDQARLIYRPARDEGASLPGWIDAALAKATHPDPLMRYDALSEFLVDLQRPSAAWATRQHVPLIKRNPTRFWQWVSAVLALICWALIAQIYL